MTNSEQNFDGAFESFDEVLAEANCEVTASEMQGIFCGLISAGAKSFCCQTRNTVYDLISEADTFEESVQESIGLLFAETLKAFKENDALPIILIPHDDFPLLDRMEGIAQWCQGFLLGFGLQLGDNNNLKPEINEAIKDISDISQLDISVENAEEDEKALELLIEHLKVAVKVIYLELVFRPEQVAQDSQEDKATIH